VSAVGESRMVIGELKLRVVVEGPPPGVSIQVQRGRSGLLAPTRRDKSSVSFDFSVRLGPSTKTSALRFLGEFAQGPADGRFVYICSGKRAGQLDSCWDRRAKVALGTITPEQARLALKDDGHVLEARVQGTAKDGGPLCASVPLLGRGWVLRRFR
jgi:hypothetical protein